MIDTLVGPYRVLERLGSGGMGEVLLAEDTRLHRRVALKRLTAKSLDGAEERTRVMREARALARLHHPGIASVFDVVQDAGMVVIVMEYVEGDTLAARMRAGRLELAQAIDLGVQIAETIAEAHANGVLHCDLKPSNILLTQSGRAKILDFGLAQVTASAAASDVTRQLTSDTSTSGIAGTAGYMAPERATGAPPDERGDIYALGVIVFEMLTGSRPFPGDNLVSVAVSALTTPPPSASDLNPSVSSKVSAVIAKALAGVPDARFQSATALATALREATLPAAGARRSSITYAAAALFAAALVGAAIVGVPRWRSRDVQATTGPAPAVVVKPFTNLAHDAARASLGIGITDDLTAKLAAISNVAVVSRDATAAYLVKSPNSTTIARDLGASFVVDGGFDVAGDRLRVSIAARSADGRVAWTKDYERPLADLPGLQRTMGEDLARGLNFPLSKSDRSALETPSTTSVEALADYSQGRQFLDRKDVKGSIGHAIEQFERAIAKDPGFALPHAGLGSAYWEQYRETKDAAWTARAIAESLEALRLNPNLAEVHVALGTIYSGLGQTPAAVEALGKALALQPNNDDAHRILGDIRASEGRTDDAVREYQQAIRIRPNYFQNYNKLAVALMGVGRYAEAADAFRRVTELQPDSSFGFNNLGVVAMMQDDLPLALTSLTRAAQITPKPSSFSNIGTVHFWNGRFTEARRAYDEAIALSPDDATLHRNKGDALAALKDRPGAERAYLRALELTTNQLRVNPKDVSAMGQMAVLEAKLGRNADAIAHARQALALAPKDANALYRSAVIAALTGDATRALVELKAAVAAGYSLNQVRHDLDLGTLYGNPDFTALVNAK